MLAKIKKFPWFEVALIVGLAIALIVRPQNQAVSSPVDEQGSLLLPLKASTQPRASL
jgi:hypothetical protein